MRFECEIDNIRTLKSGMKITLTIDDERTPMVMQSIYNFMDKPVVAELMVDVDEQRERLGQISHEQRKKIYAILGDMENYTGDSVENLKLSTKQVFLQNTQWEDFSLSNCNRELACDYIEFLVGLCFEMGIPLHDNPVNAFADVERYLALCLDKKVCAICGKSAEVHHWDAIGMGHDRRKFDDSKHRRIALCRQHHTEAHAIGVETFKDKYHVYGILWE